MWKLMKKKICTYLNKTNTIHSIVFQEGCKSMITIYSSLGRTVTKICVSTFNPTNSRGRIYGHEICNTTRRRLMRNEWSISKKTLDWCPIVSKCPMIQKNVWESWKVRGWQRCIEATHSLIYSTLSIYNGSFQTIKIMLSTLRKNSRKLK